jgi:hypothetical protein
VFTPTIKPYGTQLNECSKEILPTLSNKKTPKQSSKRASRWWEKIWTVTLQNSNFSLDKLGTMWIMCRHLTYSHKDSPMLYTQIPTSWTTHKITTNGRDVFYRDNDNLSMSKHVSTTLGRPRPLTPLKTTGGHILIIKRHEVIEIPTLWTPLQVEFEREEEQSQQTILQEETHHFPHKEGDEEMVLI